MKTFLLIITSLIITTHAYAMPSFQELKDSYKKSDAVLLDRHGEVIHELRVDSKGRRLDWVSLNDISPALIKAVISSEDKRFYEHAGVDWWAVGSAAIKNLFTQTSRGASTITMQLSSMLEKSFKPKGSKRTLSQKWDQIQFAKEMEKTWTKDEIIEAYLNLITFRGELQGISAASRGLFDKEPNGLNESESLILASLIRSPNASVSDVIKRACALKESMKLQILCDDIKNLSERKLSGPYTVKPHIALAPHVARQLLNKGNSNVVSTLDGKLQRFATDVLKYQLDILRNQNVHDGAVLVVENKTGDILAYVGNSGSSSRARYIDGITAKRQAGSTLKPFLYELAIEQRLLTPASIIDDSPLNVLTPVGLYIPENYDNDFKGHVSVRTSLSASLNVPAVRTLMVIGPDAFVSRLRQLRFDSINESGDYYGYSLALGTADVSLYELVNAYRTLANHGKWSDLRLIPQRSKKITNQIMGKEAVFIISDILSDRGARSITFGFENPLATRFWTAVKTGTSKDMRDNWCIGYSQKYTVGVWVGNFTGEPMWNVSGVTGAAPVWLEIMNYLHRNNYSISPQPPTGVELKNVKFHHDIESPRDEWFIQGTELSSVSLTASTHKDPRIIYPSNKTIIALDPDIPEEHRLLFFEAQPSDVRFDWILNNEKIGDSHTIIPWNPKQGKYTLSLVDKQNRTIDAVEFEVRG